MRNEQNPTCNMPKIGKPIGYVSVLAKGLMGMQQRLENVKIVAICMDCYQKKYTEQGSDKR
jgi:hypothetical protein